MKKQSAIFLFIASMLWSVGVSAGSPYFAYSPDMREAYQRAMELKLSESAVLLAMIKENEPDNHLVFYIENYLDFIKVFVDEDKTVFDNLTKTKDKRLEILENNPVESPYYRYTQAEIKMHWAFLHLKFGEYYRAYSHIKSAYHLQQDNLEKYPHFIPSRKSLGILHSMLGTIPSKFKWVVKLLSGMEGDLEKGLEEIETSLTYYQHIDDPLFETEVLMLYAFVALHIHNESRSHVWDLLQNKNIDPKESLLACFVMTSMAMQIGKNDEAIHLLENRPKGYPYYKIPYLDFMYGLAKFRRLDDDASSFLQKYIDANPKANHVKEAYQKMAWQQLLAGDENGYLATMQLLQSSGKTIMDSDQSAQNEAQSGLRLNPVLLKARVLFDGGYYQRAATALTDISKSHFDQKHWRLEYTYRLGRIMHEQGHFQKALNYYYQTIQDGRQSSFYYACNAALQSGLIYEALGEKDNAKAAYRDCLSMSPNQYKSGLHGKAKIGLKRLD